MKKQLFIKNKTAVAGIIEFILLIGLFAVVLSMIQLTYIPEVMEQKEAEHMEEISNQFSRLKVMIDIQSQQKTNIPISTLITLGSNNLPYFATAPSNGEISISDNDHTEYDIIVNDEIYCNLTSIKYRANNLYFVSQCYIYEGGGVLIKQPEGNPVMWVDPPFNATANRDAYGQATSIDIYYNIPIIICNKEKSLSGFEKCFITTNYSNDLSDSDWNYLPDITNIKISSEYLNAWFNYINSSFHKDVKNNITYYQNSEYTIIEKKGSIEINLYSRKTYIYARVE